MLRLTHVTQLDQGVANMCFQAWQNVEHLWYNEGKSAARWKCYQHPNAPDPTQGVRPMSSFPDSTPSDDTITIPLTRGYETIVDAVDADLAELKWYARVYSSRSGQQYAVRKRNRNDSVSLHRVIFARMLGRELKSNELVDHINGEPLDNRRTNLRLSNRSQNACNAKKRADNTSGLKGVSKFRNMWRADICHHGQRHVIGYFDTPEEAHNAYREAAVEMFGEFARFE